MVDQYLFNLCRKFDQFDRLKKDDLSLPTTSTKKQQRHDEHRWDICKSIRLSKQINETASIQSNKPIYRALNYCRFDALFEQSFQLKFFRPSNESCSLTAPICVQLPPKNYRWVDKYIVFPTPVDQVLVPWSNLGLNSWEDLSLFNTRYRKNMFHFKASHYGKAQEKEVDLAARYIPFAQKIRNMLEIGAGGGLLSLILNKRYDVTVLNTAFVDFPYCEYITERGGLCVLIDGKKVMPFVKQSFDVIHHSWVFHSSDSVRFIDAILDQNRILRPGGYLWICDGLSNAQYETIRYLLLERLGYKIIFEEKKKRRSITAHFKSNPYEIDWHVILVKPVLLVQDVDSCL